MTINKKEAAEQFAEANAILKEGGYPCVFIKHTDYHYQLKGAGWLINLYPTTGTICVDSKRFDPPPFEFPKLWDLIDIAECVCEFYDSFGAKQ